MCGVASIFAYKQSAPPVSVDELLRIREHMVARGPDGSGNWMSPDKRIGLAHRRLAVIDLSDSGAQPMATANGRFRITFNGEIYNYRELRGELRSKGYRFQSSSDTEVLLHLYAERGPDMVHALRGMYAFAIWDERQRALFLARDPLGIKPLYYADDGSTIRIASQVKALLKGGKINAALDPAGHVGFLLWGHVPEPFTLYKGIRALPAGTSMLMDTAGRKETRQFFNISHEFAKAGKTRISVTRDEMRERLRAALRDSVRHHLIADVPVGVLLSAGLDSTTLAALASEEGQRDRMDLLQAVTLGFHEFEGTANDEVPLAECVARHYGAVHHTGWIKRDDFQREIQQLLVAMDQPSTDGVNTYFACKVAREVGLKVVVSGLGGDELFGGYPTFRQIPRMTDAIAPFQSIPHLGKGFRYLAAPILKHFTSPKYAGLLEYGGTYGGAYLLRRGMFMPWELPDLLDGDVVRKGWNELQTIERLEQTTRGIDNKHCKIAALECGWYMRNQLLRDSDWASMAHSLELRVPFVDVELFRAVIPMFNAACPPGKLDMAHASRPPLPDQVLHRNKTGFSIPIQNWLPRAGRNAGASRGLRGWAKIVLGLADVSA